MEALAAISDVAAWFHGPKLFIVCSALVLLLYIAARKRSELSFHALQNTSATVLVYLGNIAVLLAFQDDLNAFFRKVYTFVHIPPVPEGFWDGRVWLGMMIAFIGRDFCDYLIHRIMHTKWMWPTHAAHHSDTHVNAFSTFRVHFFEPILMGLTYTMVLTWLQLPELLPLVVLLATIHNMYVHMDLDWDHGPFKYVLASPRFHRWHHADVPEAYGKNLANLFPIFDVIFGTYYVPGPCRATMGALSSGIEDKNPVLIWVYPFQEWFRLIRQALQRSRSRPAAPELPPAE